MYTAELYDCDRDVVKLIVDFLRGIGLDVHLVSNLTDSFLPGVKAIANGLVVDAVRLQSPGDLLHEAGHLALLSPSHREAWEGDFTDAEGFEMGAIAWSYAASEHLGLPMDLLFHADGYKGESLWLAELFNDGPGLGVPILQWRGLCDDDGTWVFPKMRRWLCDLETTD